MSQKSASPTPQCVLEWAERARRGNALRPWIRPRYWEAPRERQKWLETDFDLALRALDRIVGPGSEMVRTGAWSSLETHSNAAADEDWSPDEVAVTWLLRAVLLPVHWEHVPHVSKGELKEAWEQTVIRAKLLRREVQQFRHQIAYKHPGLATVADLVQLHRLRQSSIDPDRWQPPRMDHTGLFGGYRAEAGDETLLDLLNVLIVTLESKITEDIPPSVQFPGLYEKKRGVGATAKASAKESAVRSAASAATASSDPPRTSSRQVQGKPQPLYMRRNFFLKSLKAISEGQGFAFDANLIAACAFDLLVAAADARAAKGCTASYVRLIFEKKQETRGLKKS